MSTTVELGTFSADPRECIALTPTEVDYAWKKVLEPRIASAVELTNGELISEDVYQALVAGHMFAWVIYHGSNVDAVLVLEPVQLRHFRICRIVVVAGEGFDLWKHFEPFIEYWARGMNCQFIDGLGRPGWKNAAKELGYEHQYTVFRKKVTLGVH